MVFIGSRFRRRLFEIRRQRIKDVVDDNIMSDIARLNVDRRLGIDRVTVGDQPVHGRLGIVGLEEGAVRAAPDARHQHVALGHFPRQYAALPVDVPPDGSVAVGADVLAPPMPGRYMLEVQVFRHGVPDPDESLERMVGHAVEQVASGVPGSDVIVARLAEVLFAEALRRYVLQLPPQRTGWLAGAADPNVGRALAEMHQRPAYAWTLEELADVAGVSRSTLGERFARYLGQGPMAYLADWRLELAAESLRTTSRSVLNIAGDVGYESEAAFNRAFKRRFALPPARYRKSLRAGATTVPIEAGTNA